MERDKRITVRVDERTVVLLRRLANRTEGNCSQVVRQLVRAEAERAGLVMPEPKSYFEREGARN